MSDEATTEAPEAEATQEEVPASVETPAIEENQEEVQKQTPEESQAVDEDLYDKARQQNESLKAELKEIEESDDNVFAQNESLKKKIEDAKRIREVSEENAKLQAELNGIKKAALIEEMQGNGQLTVAMGDWAEEQGYEGLQQYAKIAPKHKTILHEINKSSGETDIAKQFNEEQNRGRILP